MRFLVVCVFLCLQNLIHAQPLARKASLGIVSKTVKEGMRVDSVLPNSTAFELKLHKNDVLVAINDKMLTPEMYSAIVSKLKTGDKISIKYLRSNKQLSVSGKVLIRPFEQSSLADLKYDWVKFRNGYLRTITRVPKGKTNVPCILLIPGYGCGSIENYSQGYNGKLINEWLKNGYAVVTIEKSGMGDSQNCPPCTEVDLGTDIESFNAGYQYMEGLDFADKKNLFIWGHSMGGVIAPEIAKLHQPKGVMVFGTVYRPWSEFLLEMHRIQKPLLDGFSYEQTENFVRVIQKIYYEFFVLKKTPAELYENPEYKELVSTELEFKAGNNNMWGRHWRFWQELDSLNLAKSWKETNCPVLVLNGGSDYEQCAPIEPVLIEQTVNTSRPGTATRIQIDSLDHFMMKSKDFKEAVENFKSQAYSKGNFNQRIATETINWLNKQTGKS